MHQNFDFSNLPLEIQMRIIIMEDLPTISHLCRTNREINSLCKRELLWKKMFYNEFYSKFPSNVTSKYLQELDYKVRQISKPPDYFITSTWLNQVKFFKMLQNPKEIICFFQYSVENVNDVTLLSNYKTTNIDSAKQCIVDDYNSKNGIVYIYLRSIITQLVQVNKSETHLGMFDEDTFESILTEQRLLDVIVLQKIIEAAGELDINLSLRKTIYFDLRDLYSQSTRTQTLFSSSENFGGPLFTISVDMYYAESFIYSVMVAILNYRFMYYQELNRNRLYTNKVMQVFIGNIALSLQDIVSIFYYGIENSEEDITYKLPEIFNEESLLDAMKISIDNYSTANSILKQCLYSIVDTSEISLAILPILPILPILQTLSTFRNQQYQQYQQYQQ